MTNLEDKERMERLLAWERELNLFGSAKLLKEDFDWLNSNNFKLLEKL
jgi:hypothetical protein